jgi:uncharacterized protein
MELEHSFTVPVPEERAWNVLLDVERVAPCMPGATLQSVDGDVVNGSIKVKVGPIAMTYAGTARFTERDASAHLITLEASGRETRGAGTASAKIRSMLAGQGDETQVIVHTTLNVTGRPAQFGRGVLAEVGGKLIGIFAANLAEMLAADQGGGGNTAGGSPSDDGQSELGAAGDDAKAELSAPLEELHLPLRSYNSLRREGVATVAGLAALSEQQLLAIEGIGPASVQEISKRLADHGLALAQVPAAPPGAASGDHADGAASGAPAEQAPAGQAPDASAAERPADDNAIDLLSVAGLPVLKRAAPVLAGLAAAALIALGVRYRRRHRTG